MEGIHKQCTVQTFTVLLLFLFSKIVDVSCVVQISSPHPPRRLHFIFVSTYVLHGAPHSSSLYSFLPTKFQMCFCFVFAFSRCSLCSTSHSIAINTPQTTAHHFPYEREQNRTKFKRVSKLSFLFWLGVWQNLGLSCASISVCRPIILFSKSI